MPLGISPCVISKLWFGVLRGMVVGKDYVKVVRDTHAQCCSTGT